MNPQRRAPIAGVATLATLLLISACSGGNPTSPRANAPDASVPQDGGRQAPTPEATVDPDAVAAAFLDFVRGPVKPWVVTYTGKVVGDGIDIAFDAELRDIGESEAMDTTVSIDGKTNRLSTVRIHDEMFTSTNEGPWLPGPPDTTFDFMELFANVRDLDLIRVEEDSDGTCWWFSVNNADIPAAVFQVQTDPKPTYTITRFDIELHQDGTPMAAEVEADVAFGAADTAQATYRWEFSEVGDPRSISAPDDSWMRVPDAGCRFSVAYPGDMIAGYSDDGCASFTSLDNSLTVHFSLVRLRDITIPLDDPLTDEQAQLISDSFMREYVDRAASRERIELAGRPAVLSTYRWKDKDSGIRVDIWLVTQRRDRTVYLIDGSALASDAKELRATFEAMLGTVEFED